eukprot:3083645-Ditylum_brightwellii.AAC.1
MLAHAPQPTPPQGPTCVYTMSMPGRGRRSLLLVSLLGGWRQGFCPATAARDGVDDGSQAASRVSCPRQR